MDETNLIHKKEWPEGRLIKIGEDKKLHYAVQKVFIGSDMEGLCIGDDFTVFIIPWGERLKTELESILKNNEEYLSAKEERN